jgi:hypothetical protein
MKMNVLYNVVPCSMVETDRRFRGTLSIIRAMIIMADSEKCNRGHIIENLFLPSIYSEFLHTY